MVPALWHYEVANSLAQAVKRGRITAAELPGLLTDILSIKFSTVQSPVETASLAQLAVETRLSAYDCAYLMLARQRSATIATLDARLGEAAKVMGLDVLQVS